MHELNPCGVGQSRAWIYDPTLCGVGLSWAKIHDPLLSSLGLSRSRIHDPSLSDKVQSSSFAVWGCSELGSTNQTLWSRAVQGYDPRHKPLRCWVVQGATLDPSLGCVLLSMDPILDPRLGCVGLS